MYPLSLVAYTLFLVTIPACLAYLQRLVTLNIIEEPHSATLTLILFSPHNAYRGFSLLILPRPPFLNPPVLSDLILASGEA